MEFDGAGRVRRKANDHPGGTSGKYSGQQFVFDKVGMQTDASNVISIYGDWTKQPEDAATGWVFTSYNTRNLLTGVSYNDGGATPSVSFGYNE